MTGLFSPRLTPINGGPHCVKWHLRTRSDLHAGRLLGRASLSDTWKIKLSYSSEKRSTASRLGYRARSRTEDPKDQRFWDLFLLFLRSCKAEQSYDSTRLSQLHSQLAFATAGTVHVLILSLVVSIERSLLNRSPGRACARRDWTI